MKAIWQSLAVAAAVGVAACPVDPQIDPTDKLCDGGVACPVGFDCYHSLCVPVCTADETCDPDAGLPTNVLAASPCHCTSDCPCPQQCLVDPYWVSQGLPTVCEYSCDGGGTALDCLSPGTVCTQNACVANTCTDLYEPCNAAGTNDGTCLPLLAGGSGECLQGGSFNTDGFCLLSADRSDPSLLCPVGKFCEPNADNDGGACADVCIPSSEFAQCPNDPGDACLTELDGVGVCEPPE